MKGQSDRLRRLCPSPVLMLPFMLGLVAAGGCGQPRTVVTGVVTLDGKPIEKGILTFTPERRDAPTATAVTDRNGVYSLEVSAVPFRVTIVAQRVVGQTKNDVNPNGPPMDVVEDVVPGRYGDPATTTLRTEPAARRRTVANFELSSESKKPILSDP